MDRQHVYSVTVGRGPSPSELDDVRKENGCLMLIREAASADMHLEIKGCSQVVKSKEAVLWLQLKGGN